MQGRPPRTPTALAAVVTLAAACSHAPERPPPAPAAAVVTVGAPAARTTPEEPRLSREEALARGQTIAEAWREAPRFRDRELPGWLRDHQLEEPEVIRVLASIAGPCLEERGNDGAACHALADGPTGAPAEALVELLAEVADIAAGERPAMRLLVRLEARGYYRSIRAIERVLERRMVAGQGACAPPSDAEIQAARASLADFAVVEPAPRAGGLRARKPAERELSELAYLVAAVSGAAPEVGMATEDPTAQRLPEDHPDVAARAGLEESMRQALLDGDLARHARAAEAYLKSLGYPGPIRSAEDLRPRWGGQGFSFVMRDLARSAEIAGRYELAEALYRRAAPGGGSCGTSTASRREAQLYGAIRSAEQRRGCRGVVAERLFTVSFDLHKNYGPERLAAAGFDVPRLYAGALLTLGRDDPASLERALRSDPDALARLGRLGPEAWATRLRAVGGYADTAGAAGIDRLLALTEHAPPGEIVELLRVIALVAEDRGHDPCAPGGRLGWRRSSKDTRNVRGVMSVCATRIDKDRFARAVRKIAAMAGHADPTVREAVALALGRMGSPLGRGTLQQLARDPFDGGGQVCITRGDEPAVCEPNRPVARAAREALEALGEADKARAERRVGSAG
jgi:hypothetical protein